MAKIYGQIESLKKIRLVLNQNGITRFNSIRDVNEFIKYYDNEKEELIFRIEQDFDLELDVLQGDGFYLQKEYDTFKNKAIVRLKGIVKDLQSKCITLESSPAKNALLEITNWYQLLFFKAIKVIIEKNFNNIIWLQISRKSKSLKRLMNKINNYSRNRQEIISERCEPQFKDLEYTKSVVTELNPLIAGAIGENLVKKELEKLSDRYVLFNDFSLEFEKPIYNKHQNDRIFSIQIDHLLVTNAGIFIIETKNWSTKSIERFDLRSPVQQIQRASFALFVILNNQKSKGNSILKRHHWGDKKLPIRNIVAMINNKPKEKFKFVTIKKLKELNNYINYFKPIFDESEVGSIVEYLIKIKN